MRSARRGRRWCAFGPRGAAGLSVGHALRQIACQTRPAAMPAPARVSNSRLERVRSAGAPSAAPWSTPAFLRVQHAVLVITRHVRPPFSRMNVPAIMRKTYRLVKRVATDRSFPAVGASNPERWIVRKSPPVAPTHWPSETKCHGKARGTRRVDVPDVRFRGA